jgi:DNA polymerase I-like protein with 3'-5' exonuclease and polymerase domains
MSAKKAQETYNNTNAELAKESDNFEPVNISLEEGKIILLAQKRAIPDTFNMVERNVELARSQGYLVLNERSKSRIWFYEIAKLKQKLSAIHGTETHIYFDERKKVWICANDNSEHELSFSTIRESDGQSRNVPISGTQADMVKEAMVEIDNYIEANGLDCHLLSQVHDELVYSCPKEIDGHDTYSFNFPEYVRHTMTECANRYLINVKMKASVEVADTWIK